MEALAEVRALHLALDAGAWVPTVSDHLLARLVEADVNLVTAQRVRAALTEVGHVSGPLADVLREAEVALIELDPMTATSYQREVMVEADALPRAICPHLRDTDARPL